MSGGRRRWSRILAVALGAGALGAAPPVLAAGGGQPHRRHAQVRGATSSTVPDTTTLPTTTTTTVPDTTTTVPDTTTTTTVPDTSTTTPETTTTTPVVYPPPSPGACGCQDGACGTSTSGVTATARFTPDRAVRHRPRRHHAHTRAETSLAASWLTKPVDNWDVSPKADFSEPLWPQLSDPGKVEGTCPVVLAEGDSVTSGHNIDHYQKQDGRLLCEDATYPYPYFAWVKMRGDDRWKDAPYVNAGFSGFGTQQVLEGGKDACNRASSVKPIDVIAGILHKHQQDKKIGDGNVVVQSVGINDAPWTDKLIEIIKAQDKIKVKWPHVVIGGMSEAKCAELLKEKWDPIVNPALKGIRERAATITKQLIGKTTGDPNVKIFWLDYYNFAGTGYVQGSVKLPWNGRTQSIAIGPILPSGCEKPFDERRKKVDQALHEGVADAGGNKNVQFIDTGLDGQGALLQPVIGADGLKEAGEALVASALKTAKDKLEEAAFKTLLETVKLEERAVDTAKALVDKLSGKPKEEAEKALEAARRKLGKAEEALQAYLEKTIENEGKVDWDKAGLKSYFELGWPHPNARGHAQIAAKILAALGVKGKE